MDELIVCARCGDLIDEMDVEEGEYCCACETELIDAQVDTPPDIAQVIADGIWEFS